MRNRSDTTGLMVEDSLKDYAIIGTVGMLSLPVEGARQAGLAHTKGNVASCRTRAASSKSEFVMRPPGLS